MDQKLDAKRRLLLRAAERIRGCLHQAQIQSVEVELPVHHWIECETALRRIRLAQSRGWHHAAAALTEALRYPLCQCLERLNDLCNRSLSGRPSETVAAVPDIFADLEALLDEFDDLSIDLPEAVLSVTTAPIVLDNVLLGRFQVRLHWGWIGRAHPYEVLALEPNRACSSESTTHPHIVDERLCEGDGKMPIARALHQGRLLDFFQIVNRVLNTYNPSSAYVALSDWEGRGCSDCGEIVGPDDERTCSMCEGTLCGNCALTCERCEAPCCYECSRRCDSCGHDLCRGCAHKCEDCHRLFCEPCLSECDLCPECQEKDDERSLPDPESAAQEAAASSASPARESAKEASSTAVTILPDGLGQALVLA
jgi:hypothetical protein